MNDELKFVEGLYDYAEGETKDIYEQQKKARDELLNQIALIMLSYTVLDGVMKLSRDNKIKEYSRLSKLIKSSCKATGKVQENIIEGILTNTSKNTFEFYSYNVGLKDVQALIDKNFKRKHFSERVWENENQVASHLHKQVNDFLQGKVNVNQIKSNVEKIYNTSAYNAKRLVETEVARVENDSFKRFCNETGVKKVRRNAVLDNRTCNDCSSFNGKVYELRDAPDLPVHPLCRCFYEIVDDTGVSNKIDYMGSRFVPKYGEEKEVKLGNLLISEKKVVNSNFNMWTDLDATSKSKAVRLYEKKLKNIENELPDWFEIPKVSIINFEKNGLEPKAIGGYQREINTIFINSNYDTDAKILKYLKSKEGYFANIESNSPLLHELGHKYHYDLVELIANKKILSYNNAKEIFDSGISKYILNENSVPRRFISEQLSKYAADYFGGQDRMNEIMAEYFSIKNKNPKTELVKFIEDYIKGVEKL